MEKEFSRAANAQTVDVTAGTESATSADKSAKKGATMISPMDVS